MKLLVIVFDKYVSDDLWEFILGDCLSRYKCGENEISGIGASYVGDARRPRTFDSENEELLVVCESESQAKKLAKCMRLNMTPKQFGKVICLESYEGKHYFENCIRSLQPLKISLGQILDAVYKPGVVNLDYSDLQQMVQGTENYITALECVAEKMKNVMADFLRGKSISRCLVNLTGNFTMTDASEIAEVIGNYEDVLLGAAPEEGEGEMQATVIYGLL